MKVISKRKAFLLTNSLTFKKWRSAKSKLKLIHTRYPSMPTTTDRKTVLSMRFQLIALTIGIPLAFCGRFLPGRKTRSTLNNFCHKTQKAQHTLLWSSLSKYFISSIWRRGCSWWRILIKDRMASLIFCARIMMTLRMIREIRVAGSCFGRRICVR